MGSQTNETMSRGEAGAASLTDSSVGNEQRPGFTKEASAGGTSQQPTNAFYWARIVHRALRGRYRTTAVIALAAASIGALGGWRWMGSYYRSEGMVRIASSLPPVIQETDQTRTIPMFDSFMQAQQEMVTSRTVLEESA